MTIIKLDCPAEFCEGFLSFDVTQQWHGERQTHIDFALSFKSCTCPLTLKQLEDVGRQACQVVFEATGRDNVMLLAEAEAFAHKLIVLMSPFCQRCEIAGSIRRRKEEVKDIEIVAIPKLEQIPDPSSLFAEPLIINRLHEWALSADIQWIKPGTDAIISWNIQPEGKYWRGLLPSGIKLDLFIAAPDNWGIIFAIRTGSKDFTTALVTRAKQVGHPCKDGYLHCNEQPFATPEERDVFELLALEWIEPEQRNSFNSLRRKGQ